MRKAEPKAPKRLTIKHRFMLSVFPPVLLAALIAAGTAVFFAYAYFSGLEGFGSLAFKVAVPACCAIIILCLAAVFAGLRFVNGIGHSLRGLTALSKRISDGSYGIRGEKPCDDELGDLSDGINEVSEKAAQGERLQTEFVSSVSHELRTPLTAITGWAETLAYDEAIQGDSRRGVAIISREASRLTKMVEELLEFTRIQDGRFNLNIEKLDVAAELEDTVFTYSKLLMQDGVELSYAPPEEEPPVIDGDPERLKQVFLNIIDNAAKYGREGGKVLVSLKSDSGHVMITTRDFGCGIPEEELPHVKEKFYKGSSKQRGSGIGLSVCEEIVTRHGGTLTIENAPGGGVLVTVSLPVSAANK